MRFGEETVSDGEIAVNSSPLIALEHIGHLDLVRLLFGTVCVPPAVARETAPTVAKRSWIIERPLSQPLAPQLLRVSLGPGESEAISLALEIRARWLVIDDRSARRLAAGLHIPVVGTLGLLLASKRRNFTVAVRPALEALLKSGFHVAPGLSRCVLLDAGEGE